MSRRDALAIPARRASYGLVVLLLAVAGCGSRKPLVSGTVKFEGQPLPSGTVLFHGSDGRVGHGLITEGGRYTITDAPLGPVRITVHWHPAAPPGFPSSGGEPPVSPSELTPAAKPGHDDKVVEIPVRYLDPEKSGLTYAVSTGAQTHDIELEP